MGEFTGLKMVSFYFIYWKQSWEDMQDHRDEWFSSKECQRGARREQD